MSTRTVTWGEGILVAAHRAGGLNPIVERIHRVVGKKIGVRNSFAKLYNFTSPEALKDADKERAWYLLTALGENPSRWGIYDDALPPLAADQIDVLKVKLCAPRDSNPEPTDYGTARGININPLRRGRTHPINRHGNTHPKGRA